MFVAGEAQGDCAVDGGGLRGVKVADFGEEGVEGEAGFARGDAAVFEFGETEDFLKGAVELAGGGFEGAGVLALAGCEAEAGVVVLA